MEQVLFGLYALLACGGALAVVLSQNIVRMAFYLVISLGSTAALFFLLGADFIGATQLLIYVGGTVVLLIFGVMLTASSPYSSMRNTPAEILQGAAVGLAFLLVIIATVLSVEWDEIQQKLAGADHHGHPVVINPDTGFNPVESGNTSRSIGTALLGLRFDKDLTSTAGPATATHTHGDVTHSHPHPLAGHAADGHSHQPAEPATLSTGYLLPFEIISVHLLVVLIGASYLARAKRAKTTSVA